MGALAAVARAALNRSSRRIVYLQSYETKTGTIGGGLRYSIELGNQMIKLLSALAISSFIATALFVLPGFAPPLEANLPLKKGDQLINTLIVTDCSKQMWPNFSVSCLHGKGIIGEARLIHARG